MSKEMDFFIFLLESYAQEKGISAAVVLARWDALGISAAVVLARWDALGISDAIYNNYWIYHTEALENAFEDIDSLTLTGKPAW